MLKLTGDCGNARTFRLAAAPVEPPTPAAWMSILFVEMWLGVADN